MCYVVSLIPCLMLAVCLLPQAPEVQVARLYPVDDTSRDPSFRSYVGRLRSAVNARNLRALRKLVDDDVVVGPGDDDKGWDKFTVRWRLEDAAESPLWAALADLLSLGFLREHPSLYLSPYVVWRFPPSLNPKGHLVVIRDAVPLRTGPSLKAATNGVLSFDIVRPLGPPQGKEELIQWIRVAVFDGRIGYVTTRDVMSPAMPRAQFALREGHWLLTALEDPDR